MKQIIVADKNNNLIQFNFFDIDKMKKFKKIYENRERKSLILQVIMASSLLLMFATQIFILISNFTMDEKSLLMFSDALNIVSIISLIILGISFLYYFTSFNKKTHYDRYNDIITIYDYIYNDDFHNITFDCLDNYISFENIDFANIDFPIVLKTNQIIYEENLDVNYIIDIGIYKEIYYCNVTSKGK